MGSCFSAESTPPPPSAKVITSNGQLRLYPIPAAVSLVLDREAAASPSFFICNSDALTYDNFIPVLDFHDLLQPNQIYFILPTSKLLRHLSAADMAAMAVVASSALASDTGKTRFRRYRSRISPVLVDRQRVVWEDKVVRRSASRRAKMAVRSFRLRLTTINEGATIGLDDSIDLINQNYIFN